MGDKNIFLNNLTMCSKKPMTGYTRDGYCRTNLQDSGNHLVCAEVDKKFLNFSKSKGNDLTSILNPGDNWCLCQNRWLEAYKGNSAPKVIKEATNFRTSRRIKKLIKQQKGGKKKTRKILPKLRKISKKNKKYHYHLKDPQKKRILAINEGVQYEIKHKKKTKKQAAIAKKGRFNILRIYRRNNNIKDCNKITKDMLYMDKKYKLGKTKNICGQKGGKKTKKKFLYNPNNPKKSFDVYIDKNPKDTISIKYTTVSDVKNTIQKLEKLFKNKKYSHKRIWQVGMIMKVRLEAMLKHKKTLYPNAKNVKQRFKLANKYFKFLRKRTKQKTFSDRKKMKFYF